MKLRPEERAMERSLKRTTRKVEMMMQEYEIMREALDLIASPGGFEPPLWATDVARKALAKVRNGGGDA
jgi:hypothetical protein